MSYAFEAKIQPDGSYIMTVSGKQFRCKDWNDVCRQYHEYTEGKSDGEKEHLPAAEHI